MAKIDDILQKLREPITTRRMSKREYARRSGLMHQHLARIEQLHELPNLLRLLATQVPPSSGQVELLGRQPWALSARQRKALRSQLGRILGHAERFEDGNRFGLLVLGGLLSARGLLRVVLLGIFRGVQQRVGLRLGQELRQRFRQLGQHEAGGRREIADTDIARVVVKV